MKVKFSISNFHYAKRTKDEDGTVSFGKPVHIPGAVSFNAEPQGEKSEFYADGIVYYSTYANNGYEGDAVFAMIPDVFRQEILGDILDENQVLIEKTDKASVDFACGFDIDSDTGRKIRIWYFNCSASRVTAEDTTKEENVEPTTDTVTITCKPDEEGYVRAKTSDKTPDDIYKKWFDAVYQKTGASTGTEEGA